MDGVLHHPVDCPSGVPRVPSVPFPASSAWLGHQGRQGHLKMETLMIMRSYDISEPNQVSTKDVHRRQKGDLYAAKRKKTS
jgi:hypothetical protein